MTKELNKNNLQQVNGGSSGTNYLYKYVVTIDASGNIISLSGEGYNTEAEAKTAGNAAAVEYLNNHGLTNSAIFIVTVVKYLSGDSDPFVIPPSSLKF